MSRAVLLLACALCAFSTPAHADPQRVPLGEGTTYLAVDEAEKIVTIVIDGKEVLRIDQSGLMVTGDMAYSGLVVDRGNDIAKQRDALPATRLIKKSEPAE